MKLTVKLDYACRALAGLARRFEGGGVLRIEELAQAEELPEKYLAQILAVLRNGGLVESRRGKFGGYLLARPPERITLHDVISLIEGDLFASSLRPQGVSGHQVTEAWNRLQARFEEAAKAVTIKDVISAAPEKMYYI